MQGSGAIYDRALKDVLDFQEEVALAVLGAIEPTLRQAEARRIRRKRSDSLHAYELVLQAQSDVFSGVPEPSTRALGLLDRALALEPDYALAHSFAAMCHHNRFLRGGQDDALALTLPATGNPEPHACQSTGPSVAMRLFQSRRRIGHAATISVVTGCERAM